jgi:hypothetical protein
MRHDPLVGVCQKKTNPRARFARIFGCANLSLKSAVEFGVNGMDLASRLGSCLSQTKNPDKIGAPWLDFLLQRRREFVTSAYVLDINFL